MDICTNFITKKNILLIYHYYPVNQVTFPTYLLLKKTAKHIW